MRRERNPLLTAYAVIVYVLLFAPIAILILFSFNDSRRTLRWHGFTTDWYGSLSRTTTCSTPSRSRSRWRVSPSLSRRSWARFGLGLARYRSRAQGATETLLLLPMVTPEIVMGLSLLLFFLQAFDTRGSFAQLSIAHITFCISFVAVVVRARAASMDPALEEAARDLGASAWGHSATSPCRSSCPQSRAGCSPCRSRSTTTS